MEAKELRISNYITSKSSSIYWQVMPSDIEIIFSNEQHYLPIPLTEEWLLKFGFEKKDHVWSDKSVSEGLFFKKRYFIEFSKEGILFCQLHYSGQGWFICSLDFVHQLQNLWLDLNKEYLTIIENGK